MMTDFVKTNFPFDRGTSNVLLKIYVAADGRRQEPIVGSLMPGSMVPIYRLQTRLQNGTTRMVNLC